MLVISHYTLEVKLEFAPDFFPHSAPGSLHVKAHLQVQNTGAEPASTLPLLFYRLHKVSNVTVNGGEARVASRLTGLEGLERHQVNAVGIELPEVLMPGASCTVGLEYGGVTAGAREVWPYMWDSVTRDYTLLRPDSIIWYPEAATPDKVSYHSAYIQPKRFDVTLHVPEGYTAAAPDLVTMKDGIARFRTAQPRERFDLAIAPFSRLESNGVSVYHLPSDAQWGSGVLAWVNAALNGLSDRLGPRSTGSLAIVQIPSGWGSQNTPNLILQEAGAPDNWHAAAEVMHEVSHYWTPGPSDWPKRFSDESLATFFQYILVGDVFGPEKAEAELASFQRAIDRRQGAAEAKFLDEHLSDGLHTAVWYSKGALALNSLRNQLGDERFWPLLQEYTMEQKATAKGFVELLKGRYPGPDTDAYVHHWFG